MPVRTRSYSTGPRSDLQRPTVPEKRVEAK